jgi:WS/DGAT/MGAT family acyltransferase
MLDMFALDLAYPELHDRGMKMERLSPLDASFLRIETKSAHMHVGWHADLALAPGHPPLDALELRRRIAAKLHLAPRFRQRLRDAPVGEPFWTDDARFRISDHVKVTAALTEPGELRAASDEFFSRRLDRDRPLWEILVVPRAGPGHAAVLGKVHHAMVDGIAAVELGMLLFDLEPHPACPEPVPWTPERAHSPARVAVESLKDAALEQFRAARQAAGIGLRPGHALRSADSVRRAALSLAGDLARPAPASFLRGDLSPRRVLVPARADLERVKAVARSLGVKLNDVVLAAVAGSLRSLAEIVDAPPTPQRAMVPISTRSEDERGGNRITFAFVDLPVDVADPGARLREVVHQMAALKRSGYARGTDILLRGAGLLPGPLKDGVARVASSPRTHSLTVSNVPGPTVPLYAAGARVLSIHPLIPISEGHSLSVGVVSYGGQLHFGVYADPTALPEAARLEGLLPAAFEQLEELTLASRPAPPAAGRVARTGDGEESGHGDQVRPQHDRVTLGQRSGPARDVRDPQPGGWNRDRDLAAGRSRAGGRNGRAGSRQPG